MDQSGWYESGQDHGTDRGSNVAGGDYDHGGGLADRGWYGGAGWRGVDPDILGGPARVGQGGLKEVILLSSGRRVTRRCCEIATVVTSQLFGPGGSRGLILIGGNL